MVRKKEVYNSELQSIISKLWDKKPNEWKRYHTLRNYLKQFPEFKKLSERTIMRYISQLVENGFLEKRVELNHQTWYKPKITEFYKVSLKDRIDKINNRNLLQTLDNFSLIFLAEYYKMREKQKSEPEFWSVVEASKKRFMEMKAARIE